MNFVRRLLAKYIIDPKVLTIYHEPYRRSRLRKIKRGNKFRTSQERLRNGSNSNGNSSSNNNNNNISNSNRSNLSNNNMLNRSINNSGNSSLINIQENS